MQSDVSDRTASKPMQPEDYQRIEQDLHNQLLAKRSMRHHEGQQRVDSWNFSLDSFTSAEDAHSHSAGTDYDSILSDDGEDKFYSMASAPHSADLLPPLEEPPIPADMLAMRKGNTGAISPPVLSAIQGFGYDARFMGTHSKVNIKGIVQDSTHFCVSKPVRFYLPSFSRICLLVCRHLDYLWTSRLQIFLLSNGRL